MENQKSDNQENKDSKKSTQVDFAKVTDFFSNFIAYRPELNKIFGSFKSNLLASQLEYWFVRKPDGFYKFLSSCEHPLYRTNDDWCHELGFSKSEFRSAFDQIGKRYKSKTLFIKAIEAGDDIFDGKFYVSFIDVRKGLTYYLRNNELVNKEYADLISNYTPAILIDDNEEDATDEKTESLLKVISKLTKSPKEKQSNPAIKKLKTKDSEINKRTSGSPEKLISRTPINVTSYITEIQTEKTNKATAVKAVCNVPEPSSRKTNKSTSEAAASFLKSKNEFLIIADKLSPSQQQAISNYVDDHYSMLNYLGEKDLIAQALADEISNPQTFKKTGRNFQYKLNSIAKVIEKSKGGWLPHQLLQQEDDEGNEEANNLKKIEKDIRSQIHLKQLEAQGIMNDMSNPIFQDDESIILQRKVMLNNLKAQLKPLYERLKVIETGEGISALDSGLSNVESSAQARL